MNSAPSRSATAFPPPRVAPSLAHAFGGIFRLTLRRFATRHHALTLLALLAALVLLTFTERHPGGYLRWIAGFYLTFLVPVMAFVAAAGALADELKPGTAEYVFTRPVPRWAYLVFRYASHAACAQLDFLLALAVVAGIGLYRGADGLAAALPLLVLVQLLAVIVFSALGFLGAMVTSRYVILGLAYGVVVEVGIGRIPTQLSRLSLTRHLRDLTAPLVERGAELAGGASGVLATTGLLLGVAAALLATAAAIFSLRELAGRHES